jgi:thioredoxin-like negative regulator of GroEL
MLYGKSRWSHAGAVVAICALLTLVVGGCGGSNMIHVENAAQFQQVVVQSKQPVMVEFYKLGCPTCGMIEPAMDKMADEYRGRVVFASFKLMEPYFVVTDWDIQKQYDLALIFPTVVLFVDGKPTHRWIFDFNTDGYRTELDKVAGAAPKMPAAPAKAPAPVPAKAAPPAAK